MDDKPEGEKVKHPLGAADLEETFIENGKLKGGDTSPQAALYAAQHQEEILMRMVTQAFECEWAHVRVDRKETGVEVYWAFKESAGNPMDYRVLGVTSSVALKPTVQSVYLQQIAFAEGDGGILMRGKEGVTYVFQFLFVRKDKIGVTAHENALRSISFVVGIPLSDESKAILAGRVPPEKNAPQKIRGELEDYLEKQDMFDDMCKQAVHRIKMKRLAPGDEQEKIDDFMDYARSMKEKFGL